MKSHTNFQKVTEENPGRISHDRGNCGNIPKFSLQRCEDGDGIFQNVTSLMFIKSSVRRSQRRTCNYFKDTNANN